MPVTLSQIAANTASVTFPVGDETVTIVYYPAKVTEKTFAQLQLFTNMKDEDTILAGFEALNEVLIGLMKSWDVYEDTAMTQMYPLTQERLSELPIVVRLQVLGAITGSFSPEALPKVS